MRRLLRRLAATERAESAVAERQPIGEQRTAPRRAGADVGRTAGRVVLWGFVALVLVRGVGAIFTDPSADPAPGVRTQARAAGGFPDVEARAFALRFASVYLSYSPKRPKAHQKQVSAYLAQGLSDQAAATLPSHGPGMRVAWATVAREVPLGGSRALITVATTSTTGTVRYLTVPVAQDRTGGLAVTGLPAFAPPPPKPTTTVSQPTGLSGPDAPPIRDLVGRFLTAYLAGQSGSTLRYYLAPTARVVQMPAGLKVVSVGQISRDTAPSGRTNGLSVLAQVTVRDSASGAAYPLAYRLAVARTDRWYVTAVAGGPTS